MANDLPTPITNDQKFLAAAAGMYVVLPTAITIDQQYLKVIAENSGGSGDAYTKSETDTLLDGKADLTDGKVPAAQLPSYVDDVLEYSGTSSFPATGESGKIYVAQDTNKTYRWSGSAYVEISESLALGETASTAYAGDKGKANADAISAIKDGLTIDSFADVETALAGKANTSSLAAVATSGSYNDLSNKPTIPAAQVNADWNASSGVAQILNKPTLGTAAAANTTTSITSGGTGLPTSGAVYGVTGNKNSLTTTAKTNLVSAINEINGTIGDINTVLESVL